MLDAIVEIHVRDRFCGSGFFVLPNGYLVTCAHVIFESNIPSDVVEHEMKHISIIYQERSWPVTFRQGYSNLEMDIAILKLDSRIPVPFVSLDTIYKEFDNFLIYGFQRHALEYRGYPVKGSIVGTATQLLKGGKKQDFIVLECGNIEEGLSGAPVFNVSTGKVVGVTKRTILHKGIPTGGYAIPMVTVFNSFEDLQQMNRHYSIRRAAEETQSMLVQLVEANVIDTSERYNIRCVYQMLDNFWTNVVVHYDRILSNKWILDLVAERIRQLIPTGISGIVDPALLEADSPLIYRLVLEVGNRLKLGLGEFRYDSSQIAIIGTISPITSHILKSNIDKLALVIMLFSPGQQELSNMFGDNHRKLVALASTDELINLDIKHRWAMING